MAQFNARQAGIHGVCVWIWIAVLSVCGSAAFADTLRVPDEYATIQDAITAAVDGDVVLIADGTYTGVGNRDISFLGKAITVRSQNGPESCVIDCEQLGRGFLFISGETESSVLKGLRITNGAEEYSHLRTGAGVLIEYASPRFVNCRIDHCQAEEGWKPGGGVAVWGGVLNMEGCTLEANGAEYGGGVYLCSSLASLTDTLITDHGAYEGGGIYSDSGSLTTAWRCRFVANSAYGVSGPGGAFAGVGVFFDCEFMENEGEIGSAVSGTVTMVGCSFQGNRGYDAVGGAVCGSGTFIDCEFIANSDDAGAVCGSGEFEGCLFADNNLGGAVESNEPSRFFDCQFIRNGDFWGGGAAVDGEGVFVRCLFEGNTSDNDWGSPGAGAVRGSGSFYDCEFRSNSGGNGYRVEFAGAILSDGDTYLEHCVFEDNSIGWDDRGAGAIMVQSGSLTMKDCLVEGNRSNYDRDEKTAGALCIDAGEVEITDCEFRQNVAPDEPGYAAIVNNGVLSITDSSFCESTPTHIEGEWTDLGGNSFETWCDCLHIDITNLVAGETAICEVFGGVPGHRAALLWGDEDGEFHVEQDPWCATFDFNVPWSEIGKHVIFVGTLNMNGEFATNRAVPRDAAGVTVRFQAAMKGTCPDTCMSNLVEAVVE